MSSDRGSARSGERNRAGADQVEQHAKNNIPDCRPPDSEGGNLVILRAHGGVLTKRIRRSPESWHVTGFSASAWYAAYERTVSGIGELADLLTRVSRVPDCAVIRGRARPGIDRRRCRRLCDRARHGDAVTFEPQARCWLAADFDSLPEPLGCIFPAEPEDGIEHAIAQMPEPFWEASCWWQATSSAGIKPGIRCRCWWWLSRPIEDGEAKGWLASSPVDRNLYAPVALHYVAAPILEPGTPDPVIRRSGFRQGLVDTVELPDVLPRIEPIQAEIVTLDGQDLTETDLEVLARAALCSHAVRAIWKGERAFVDRSTGHFALAAALARSGCRDPDTLHRVLVAYDRRRGHDTSKVMRPDYAARTIAAALAAEAGR
jgi:hypothetical protein